MFRINHIHLKTPDPKATADWFVRAFNFRVLSDQTRPSGDRFIRCVTEDGGTHVNFSGERTNEVLPEIIKGVHFGIEHFGFDSADLSGDIARLEALGARLEEGPSAGRGGQKLAFLSTPDGVRIELIQPPA